MALLDRMVTSRHLAQAFSIILLPFLSTISPSVFADCQADVQQECETGGFSPEYSTSEVARCVTDKLRAMCNIDSTAAVIPEGYGGNFWNGYQNFFNFNIPDFNFSGVIASSTPPSNVLAQAQQGKETCHPVIISSGHKVLHEVDYQAPGDFGLKLNREYVKNLDKGIFGYDWKTSFESRLLIYFKTPSGSRCATDLPGSVFGCDRQMDNSTLSYIILRRLGKNHSFDLVGSTWIAADSAKGMRLTHQSDGSWMVNYENGDKEHYNINGRLNSITSSHNLQWSLSYDSPTTNRLQSITHSSGRSLQFGWDLAANRVTSVTDPVGNVIQYTYLPGSRIDTVSLPALGNKQYTYDSQARITGFKVQGVVRTVYTYDSAGRVATSGLVNGVEKSTFTYTANSTTVTNPKGGSITYNYSGDSEARHLSSENRSATSACPFASALSAPVPGTGELLWKEDWKGNRTSFTYDGNRRLKTEYFNGKTTELAWDADNRLISKKIWAGAIASVACKAGEHCPVAGSIPQREELYSYYGAAKHNRLASITIKVSS